MTEPIKNPNAQNYAQRIPTNIRLEPDVKNALEKYAAEKNMGLADVVNSVLSLLLKKSGHLS